MTLPALTQHDIPDDPKANQLAASNPTASVWVNASAGSGKTTVLTKRVTRLLLNGTLPQKILCLTYTRAGAAEMSNRVIAQFSKWASCDENVLRDDLSDMQNSPPTEQQMKEARRLFARVLSCPGGLRIRTIHSFCQEILSRFPIEAGLPPHFGLIDEQELEILKSDVLDDLLREAAALPNAQLAQALSVLVATQGEHGFGKMLRDALHENARLSKAVNAAGGENELIAKIRAYLTLQPDETPLLIRDAAMQNLPEADMRQLAIWLAEGSPLYSKRGLKLAAILDKPETERPASFNDYLRVFLTAENAFLATRTIASNDIRKRHPDIDDITLREATRLLSLIERIEAAEIAELTASVLIFGGAFTAKLAQRKAARAALDYDDLIMRTEQLLTRDGIAPWILYKLDNGIDHILVDEAQDTSRAQWNIVQALTAEFYAGDGVDKKSPRTLFVVGDEKQSIFSFQNADPEAFLSLRETFSHRLRDAGQNLERIGLHTSFRSAPKILESVDAIFASEAAIKGVSADPVKHRAWKNRDGSDKLGRVEVWPLCQPAKEDTATDGTWIMPTSYEEEHDPQAELAQLIARKIKYWITHKTTLPDAPRPIAAGDMMILLRRRGRFADLMVRALKSNGVPVTGVDRMQLVSQLPVMDLLAMLRFVLLPEDDLNLATVLRGPLIGFSEDQLMALAVGRKNSLWQSVKDNASPQAIDYLTAILNEADFSTPFTFLSRLLGDPCPANALSGRKALWSRLGGEALDPIEELLNEAQNFAASHTPSLQNFVHWLTQTDKQIKRDMDHGSKEGGGQVRIMTVHASKGLEAPIVFLPDTAAVPKSTDIPKFQWSEDNIPLFLARKPEFGAARHLWQTARDRQLEEYRRLFYVALTRAERRLYICGWQSAKTESDADSSWYNLAVAGLQPLHQDHIATDDDDNIKPIIVMADSATRKPPPASKTEKPAAALPIPDWARQKIITPPQTISSLPPSSGDVLSAATPDAAFARGRIIHRLLQSLPEIVADNRASAIARFLTQPRHHLDDSQQDEIAQEVAQLLANDNFAALFATDSIAEVPLTGSIDGVTLFRQIDRLCLRGDEVWIVDYKTNRPPPLHEKDVPDAYRKQLDEYRQLLRGIYPRQRVRSFLLWTYAPRLMEIIN